MSCSPRDKVTKRKWFYLQALTCQHNIQIDKNMIQNEKGDKCDIKIICKPLDKYIIDLCIHQYFLLQQMIIFFLFLSDINWTFVLKRTVDLTSSDLSYTTDALNLYLSYNEENIVVFNLKSNNFSFVFAA